MKEKRAKGKEKCCQWVHLSYFYI